MNQDWKDAPGGEEMWRALDGAAPESLSPEARRRIGQAVEAAVDTAVDTAADAGAAPGGAPDQAAPSRRRHRRTLLAASVVLALAVGGAAGFALGSARTASAPGPAAATAGGEYLLLLHETPSTERAVREEGMEAIVAEYAEWAGGLAGEGRLVAAEKLADEAAWAGAAPDTPSAVSGFFVVRAAGPDEALRTARESPHARRGGIVEVRAVEGDDG